MFFKSGPVTVHTICTNESSDSSQCHRRKSTSMSSVKDIEQEGFTFRQRKMVPRVSCDGEHVVMEHDTGDRGIKEQSE
ncbi:hypothetical protein X975_00893, partial [Stegodyphus mimosarum]